MKNEHRFVRARCLVLLAGLAWTGSAMAQEFSAIGGPGYGYCQGRVDDPAVGRQCEQSQYSQDCFEGCGDVCISVYGDVDTPGPWDVDGEMNWNFGDAILTVTAVHAEGQRLSESEFVVSGNYSRPTGTDVEIAVLRYSGSPLDLDGESFYSAFDLVALGLIEPSDILLLEADLPGTGDPDDLGSLPFTFDVDVIGLADDEIALFVSGRGLPHPASPCPPVVPAVGPVGIVVLGLGIMIASYRKLRA